MDWQILVNFIPRFWLGIKYYSLMFSWQVEFWLAKKVLLKFQGSRAVTENQQGQRKAWRIPSPTNLALWPWPLTLKINRVPDSLKDYACTKLGENPLKDVDSRVFTRMLCSKNLTRWPWKSIGFQILLRTKYVPSLVKTHWRMLILECSQGCHMVTILIALTYVLSIYIVYSRRHTFHKMTENQ